MYVRWIAEIRYYYMEFEFIKAWIDDDISISNFVIKVHSIKLTSQRLSMKNENVLMRLRLNVSAHGNC